MKKVISGFKVYYLLYVLVAFTALLNEKSWMGAATLVLTAYGAVVGVYLLVQIIRKRQKITNLVWIIAFLVSHVFSSLMMAKYGITDNIKELFWLAFPMFVLYTASWQCTPDEIHKEIKLLSVIYVIYATVAGGVSLSMLSWGRDYNVVSPDGGIRVVGLKWGRLWGVFDDPNHGATILVVGIILAVYLIIVTKNRLFKILLALTIPVQYLYIVFSDSRTGEIALCVAILTGMGFWMYQRLHREQGGKQKKSGVIILTAVVACALIVGSLGASYGVKDAFNKYEKKRQAEIAAEKAKQEKKNTTKKPSQIGRKKDIEKDVSNGRLSIWQSGLELVETSPVYGVSFRNITNYAKAEVPDTYIVNTEYGGYYDSMHNSLVDILVSQGIIGILIIGAMLVNTLLYLRRKWRYKNKDSFRLQAVCLSILLALGAGSMFLSMIFYLNSPQNYIFWLCFGYFMNSLSGIEEKKDSEERNS